MKHTIVERCCVRFLAAMLCYYELRFQVCLKLCRCHKAHVPSYRRRQGNEAIGFIDVVRLFYSRW